MMMNVYHVQKNGERLGPFTRTELKSALTAGTVGESDVVETLGATVKQLLGSPPPLPGAEDSEIATTIAAAAPAPMMLEHQLVARQRAAQSGISSPAGKPASRKVLWIGVVVAAVLMIGVGGILFYVGKEAIEFYDRYAAHSTEQAEKPLLVDRAGHSTEWLENSFEASGEAAEPPSGVFRKVIYTSPAGDLTAYLTPDPGDGERRPAIVWAHGGFGGIGESFWQPASRKNDQSARAFRAAGIVLMCPSWRGENNNPGRFEFFYGEVEDLIAAVEYAKSLPYVDPNRVYIGGHSTGGTLALLASGAQVDCRAIFSFGGAPDMHSLMEDDDGYGNTPYALDSERDHDLRNAIRYTQHIIRPTFYFEGTDSWYTYDAEMMHEIAEDCAVPFKAFELPGDHFNILAPITALVAEKIVADTGAKCAIEFTLPELEAAWNAMHSIALADTLQKWMQEGGELALMIDDETIASAADAEATTVALKKCVANGDAAAIGLLAGLLEDCEDEAARAAFDKEAAPILRQWVRARTTGATEDPDEATMSALFSALGALADNGSDQDGALIVEVATSGFAAGANDWSTVLWNLELPAAAFTTAMDGFRAALPQGKLGYYVLRRANSALLDAEWKGQHPFDSPAGRDLMQGWLQVDEDGDFNESAAYFSAVALAFVSDDTREGLVPLGLAIPDVDVQLEAAWADVKTEGTLGLERLQQACSDLEFATTAKSYLKELGKGDAIPAEALEPEFAATADITDWLKHPDELGSVPESLKVFDTRDIYWPPAEKQITVWLFEFTYRKSEDDAEETTPVKTGYAMAGWTEWSFFDEYAEPPTPKKLYTEHCAWELTEQSENNDAEPRTFTEADASRLLRKKNADW
ncbi:MAG: dienelactone hydrolase [Verrucomicrobiales bacterium]|jgi:dienelactone hydrolase